MVFSLESSKDAESKFGIWSNQILRIKVLLDDKVFLEKIVKDGCEKANEIALKKIKKIHEIVGF